MAVDIVDHLKEIEKDCSIEHRVIVHDAWREILHLRQHAEIMARAVKIAEEKLSANLPRHEG
jgi:hypothetical protein